MVHSSTLRTPTEARPSESDVPIPLRRRDGSVRAYAIVDAADAAWVNQWRWSLNTSGYARRGQMIDGRQRNVYLHREVLGLPRTNDGLEGDHIDRDKLNCRRHNLRAVPKGKNQQNTASHSGSSSRHRGVSWIASREKWQASIQANGVARFLGYFTSEAEAARAARDGRSKLMPFAIEDRMVAP